MSALPPDATEEVTFDSAHVAREVAGELGNHLRMVREALGVAITQRGVALRVSSDSDAHRHAAEVLRQLGGVAARGHRIHPSDVRDALRILGADPKADLAAYLRDAVLNTVQGKPVTPRSPNQRRYLHALREQEVVFGVGPAGTGKTFLAVAAAVAALRKGLVRRIVLTRPAVEAGEHLGFLPGDLNDKVDPYLRPLFDALHEMIERPELVRMLETRLIEVAPLAFMRGRTLADAFVVLDEAQNTTTGQMRMFLTRLGERGRMVVTGDPTQVDLPPRQMSGLSHALRVVRRVPQVGVVRFSSDDVVRHPLVGAILDAYAGIDAEDRRTARTTRDPLR